MHCRLEESSWAARPALLGHHLRFSAAHHVQQRVLVVCPGAVVVEACLQSHSKHGQLSKKANEPGRKLPESGACKSSWELSTDRQLLPRCTQYSQRRVVPGDAQQQTLRLGPCARGCAHSGGLRAASHHGLPPSRAQLRGPARVLLRAGPQRHHPAQAAQLWSIHTPAPAAAAGQATRHTYTRAFNRHTLPEHFCTAGGLSMVGPPVCAQAAALREDAGRGQEQPGQHAAAGGGHAQAAVRRAPAGAAGERTRPVLTCSVCTGQPATIAVVGGSVTAGVGVLAANNSYVSRVYRWLNTTFPHPDHKFVTVALPATTSAYFAPCVNTALPNDTDLVLVEFTFNDSEMAFFHHQVDDRTRYGPGCSGRHLLGS